MGRRAPRVAAARPARGRRAARHRRSLAGTGRRDPRQACRCSEVVAAPRAREPPPTLRGGAGMNDTQLLERLSSAYATLEAPAPSAALAEILESGAVGADPDDER